MFRYPVNKNKYPNPRLIALATNSVFYKKDIRLSEEVGTKASLYLVSRKKKDGIEFEEADLVFLPEKFSLTLLIGMNKYGLCIEDFPDFVFILRFPDHPAAVEFISTAIDYVRMDGVFCRLNWLTEKEKIWMDKY